MSPGRAAAVDLARVRFSVDEQLAGVGLGLMALRSDVVVASHPPIADFPRDDPDWIPRSQLGAGSSSPTTGTSAPDLVRLRWRYKRAFAVCTLLRQCAPPSAGTSPACCCVTGTPLRRYAPTRAQFGSSWTAAPDRGNGSTSRVSHLACHRPTGHSDLPEPSRRGPKSVLIVVDACLAALAGAATNFNEAPNGLQLSMLIIFVLVSAALAWHASRPTLIKKSVE